MCHFFCKEVGENTSHPPRACWRLSVVSHRWVQQTFFSTEEVSAVFWRLSKGRSGGQAWHWDQQRFNKVSSEKHSEPSICQSSRRDIQDRGVPRFLWSWDSCCEHLGGRIDHRKNSGCSMIWIFSHCIHMSKGNLVLAFLSGKPALSGSRSKGQEQPCLQGPVHLVKCSRWHSLSRSSWEVLHFLKWCVNIRERAVYYRTLRYQKEGGMVG